jgi:hypothetical protein
MLHMMNGFGMFMMAWMPLVILFWIVVIAVVIWLIIRLLNHKQSPTMPYTYTPPQRPPQSYEQGYQPPQQAPGTYQENGNQYPYPPQPSQPSQTPYEQPQAQYPQPQEIPPSR